MSLNDVKMLFEFAGGLGMFLYGMNIMATGLQKTAGNKMKQLLGFLTNNRLLGVVVGALITAIIQSSSATTVMVVGFVNAEILNLTQAVGVIMGANIGTTITSWLVSMSAISGDGNILMSVLKPEFYAPLFIGIGAFLLMFAKNEKKKEIGEILVGFGVLFIGLNFMSSSVKPYSDSPVFLKAFQILGGNPVLGILVGAVVTALIQSSSASVGILQTLAMNNLVNWQAAVFITLGQNIGTCVTAVLSGIGTHKTAKRASIIHLIFNVVGAVIFGVAMWIIFLVNKGFATSSVSSFQISVFHTIFNLANTILLFPFADYLVKLSEVIIKDNKEEEDDEDFLTEVKSHLDERMLESPSFAVEAAIHEVVHMGKFTLENAKSAMSAVLTNDADKAKQVFQNESLINEFTKLLTTYLVKIDNLALTENQHFVVKNLLYTINDIERIGDHSENLAELAEEKINQNAVFSKTASEDLKVIMGEATNSVKYAIEAREKESLECVRTVTKCEDKVDELEEELHEKHLQRLSTKECTVETSVIFLDVIGNLERISDHALNIAGYVQDEV